VIHLEICTWRPIGGDESEEVELGDVIYGDDITLGQALELVLGKIWCMNSLGNVGSTLQRLRVRDTEDSELAVSYEYYLGPLNPQIIKMVPEDCYAFWYSFTRPSLWLVLEEQVDFKSLYDALVVYALHFEEHDTRMQWSPEVRRHIERIKRRHAAVA
jgi:hypothetical protein